MFTFRSDPIAERVMQVVSDQLGVPKRKIKPKHEFVEDLGAHEGDLSELMMALEDEFYIVIPSDEPALSTVEQAIDYVKMELAKQEKDAADYESLQDDSSEYDISADNDSVDADSADAASE